MEFYKIIKRPLVTEKTQRLELTGTYTVEVNTLASKVEIREAFEKLYGVKVSSVNKVQTREKFKLGQRGMLKRKRKHTTKAIVSLAGNARINDFMKIKTKD